MNLGKNQKAVIEELLKGEKTLDQIADETRIKDYKVRNILMELYDGGIVRRNEQGLYRIVDRIPKPSKSTTEVNEWIEHQWNYIPKLKNLSRVV